MDEDNITNSKNGDVNYKEETKRKVLMTKMIRKELLMTNTRDERHCENGEKNKNKIR